ncbi:hypothetical protein GYB22_04715 [bacterium]|nr:hypothetical protein [bacterium]
MAFFIVFQSCTKTTKKSKSEEQEVQEKGEVDSVDDEVDTEELQEVELVLGERIANEVTVFSEDGKDSLFRLLPGTLISATEEHEGYVIIGLDVQKSNSENNLPIFSSGETLKVDGAKVGTVLSDFPARSYMVNKKLASITGLIKIEAIKPNSIIENYLKAELQGELPPYKMSMFAKTIKAFYMTRNGGFSDYTVFEYYESWIEDPSPSWRLALIFKGNQLYGFVHSRYLQLGQTKDIRLGNGLRLALLVEDEDRDALIQTMKDFVDQVD